MKPKKKIDKVAATVPRQFGRSKALRLGFTGREFQLLWTLAEYPHFLEQRDNGRKSELLRLVRDRPIECASVINTVKAFGERKKANAIRSVLLDFKTSAEDLSDYEVAHLVCKRINQNYSGKALDKLVANVKKTRQNLAKRFPLKGKTDRT